MIRDRASRVMSAAACVVLAFGVGRASGADSTATAPAPGADSTLVRDLKKGGYIVFIRHGITNWEEKDTQEGDFSSRATQRNLSAAGRVQVADLGKAIAALRIPIEKVLASPMWRCRDTAQLAFGGYDTTGALYFKGPRYREARIKLLSTPPAAGKNLVLVGHQDPLLPIVPGLKRDQVKEGDALVFQPLGEGKFRVIVQVSPADWARLAGIPAGGSAPGAPASGATDAPASGTPPAGAGTTAPRDSTHTH